jgi:hypothetical protein
VFEEISPEVLSWDMARHKKQLFTRYWVILIVSSALLNRSDGECSSLYQYINNCFNKSIYNGYRQSSERTYRLEHSPSDILSRAYNEYKSSNNQSNNSWYINLLFSVKNWILTYLFAKKLVIPVSILKLWLLSLNLAKILLLLKLFIFK